MQAIAAVPGSTLPKLIDVNAPSVIGDDEVLCRTLQLGICGTDREILASAQPWVPPGCDHLILGHECLAEIVQVGKQVTVFSIGDFVVPVVRRAIGSPDQRVDMLALGEYTERGIVEEHGFSSPLWLDRPRHLFAVDRHLADVAILTEPLAVAEKGMNEAIALQQGRLGGDVWTTELPRVLVTGMGPIGFASILAARCRDWPVTMYGRDPADSFRARLAMSLGADYLSAHHTGLMPEDVERDGFDLVLEATGSEEVMLIAAESLASRGVMAWLGCPRVPRETTANVGRLMQCAVVRNQIHFGCVNAAPRDFQQALRDLAQLEQSHPAELRKLITARVSLEDATEHFERRVPQGIKVVVLYD